MGNDKKRKLDLGQPRITYHASNRTFDRLLKEDSLTETKEAVRRKLGLEPDAVINLTQFREGKDIDLEDDDDFDAFRVLAGSMSSANVRVTVGASNKTQAKRNGPSSTAFTPSQGQQNHALHQNELPPTSVGNRKRRRKKRKGDSGQVVDLDDPQPPKTSTPLPIPLDHDARRGYGENKNHREILNLNSSEVPIDTQLLGSPAEQDLEANMDRPQREHHPHLSTNLEMAPIKQKNMELPGSTAEVSNESSKHALGKPDKPPTKKSRGTTAQKGLSGASSPLVSSAPGHHSMPMPVLSDVEVKLRRSSKSALHQPGESSVPAQSGASMKDVTHSMKRGRSPSKSSALDGIANSSLDGPPAKKLGGNGTKADRAKKPKKKISEGDREGVPLVEELQETIVNTGDISQTRLAGPITSTGGKHKGKKTRALGQDVRTTSGSVSSVVPFSAVASNLLDEPDTRQESESNVNSATAGSADNDPSRTDKKKGSGDEAATVNADVSNEASAKISERKRKRPSEHDINAAAADLESALSKVLAANRASAEALLRESPDAAEMRTSGIVETESEERLKKLKRPSKKSKLRVSWGPDDFRDEPPSVMNGGPEIYSSHNSHSEELTQGVQSSKDVSSPCPVCQRVPLHARNQCPVILAGPEAIEGRLLELRRERTGHHSQIITELEEIVQKGVKFKALKDQKPNVNARSTSLNVPPSSAAESEGSLSRDKAGATSGRTIVTAPSTVSRGSHNSKTRDTDRESSSCSSSEDEAERNDSDDQTSEREINPIMGDASAYADIDLDALVRGPQASRRLKVADILTSHVSDSDSDGKDVILADEDDDKDFGHRATKSRNDASSDDDLESQITVDDEDRASLTELPTAPDRRHSSSQNSTDNFFSFRAVDGLGESVQVDLVGDAAITQALTADTSVLQGVDAVDDPQEQLSHDGDEADVSRRQLLIPSNQENEASSVPEKNDLVCEYLENAKISVSNSKDGPVVTEPLLSKGEHTFHPKHEFGSRAGMLSGPVLKHPSSTNCEEQEDPIEPADDFDVRDPTPLGSERHEVLREEHVVSSPSKMARRMKNRNGKTPLNDDDVAVPVAVVAKAVASTPKRSKAATADHASDADDNGKQGMAKRTRSSTRRLSSIVKATPPSLDIEPRVLGRRQLAKASTGVALEAEAKSVTKEKALAKAATNANAKTSYLKGYSNAAEPFPHASPLPEPQSLDQWETIQPSSPDLDLDSSLVDELRSSSPGECIRGLASTKPNAMVAGSDSLQIDGPGESGTDDAIRNEPLFILTESQLPFPYSQANNLFQVKENESQSFPRVSSSAETEDEEEVEASVRSLPGRQSSTGPYRKLTDIASQQALFSTSTALRPASFLSRRDKLSDLYGTNGLDEESGSDSGSGSDADAESHIPRSRRAGIAIQRKT